MSRAFVKESDDLPDTLAERPISGAQNFVTRRGAALIEARVRHLERDLGTPNPHAGALHRDLDYWRSRRASMRITEADPSPSTVMFGSRVTIERNGKGLEVSLVGEDEADPAAGLLAWTAPLARALVGSAVGEMVELETASGRETIKVIRISAL